MQSSQLEAALLGHNNAMMMGPPDEDDSAFQDEEPDEVEDFDEGQKFVGDLHEDGKIKSQETNAVFASPSAWAVACKRFINPDKKSGCGWASIKYKGKKLDAYKNIWYRKKKEEQNQERSFDPDNLIQRAAMNAMAYHRVVVKHNTIANRTLTHDANTLIECIPFSNLGKIQPFLVSLSTNAALLMDFHCHLTKCEVSGYLAGHWDLNSHNLQVTHAFPCRNTKADRENAAHVENDISKAIDRDKLTLVGWYHSHPYAAAAPTLRDVDAQLDYQIRMKGVSDNSYTPCIGIIISPYNYDNSSLESSIIAYWVVPPPESKPNEYGRPMLMSYSVIQDSVLTSNVKDEMKKCVDYYKNKDEQNYVNFSERYLANTPYIDKLKSTLISKFPRDESEMALWRHIRDILGFQPEDNDNLLSIPSVNKPPSSSSSAAAAASQQMLPTLSPSLASNLMMPTDISSLLFNSGKFPSASSLLGLPDPMAHSTLAANNMFLSTNLFKMQELLKPLSTSSPIQSANKKDQQQQQKHSATASTTTTAPATTGSGSLATQSPLKIPTSDVKKPDFNVATSTAALDLLMSSAIYNKPSSGNGNKMEFVTPEAKLSPKLSPKLPPPPPPPPAPHDYSAVADLSVSSIVSANTSSNSSKSKHFSIPEHLGFGLRPGTPPSTNNAAVMRSLSDSAATPDLSSGEKPSKIPRTGGSDYSPMLDLSMGTSSTSSKGSGVNVATANEDLLATDLSVGTNNAEQKSDEDAGLGEDGPLNLAATDYSTSQ